MSEKKGFSFPLLIIAIILGWSIFKQFDFENLKFEKTALSIVYILTFLMCVYVLIRNFRKK